MTGSFTTTIEGLDGLAQRLRGLADRATRHVGAAAFRRGEMIMAESKPLVPVVTDTLRASGFVEHPVTAGDKISVELGYGGPAQNYALRVHENPRAGQTMGYGPFRQRASYTLTKKGDRTVFRARYPEGTYSKVGQWKYLETPWKAQIGKFPADVKRAMAKAVRESKA